MSLTDDEKDLPDFEPPVELPDQTSSSASQEEEEAINTQNIIDDGLTPLQKRTEEPSDNDFPSMDEDLAAFRRELDALKVPSVIQSPDEEQPVDITPPVRRRRRSANLNEKLDVNDISDQLANIIQKATPSVDFFLYSLLCGVILGIGYLLDAPAILIMGILIVPVLGPWVGTALSVTTGEIHAFRETFGGMLTSLALIFITGCLAGFASRYFQPVTSAQALFHSRLWWPDFLLLVIGTASLTISFVHSDEKPIIPILMVAYELFLPFSAAGFGLGANIPGLWPEAGLVFLIHVALSLSISLIILFYIGFHPQEPNGYILVTSLLLAGIVIAAGFAGFGNLINIRGDAVNSGLALTAPTLEPTRSQPKATLPPTAKPTLAKIITVTPLAIKPSATQPAVTATAAVTATPPFSGTPTATLLPTPVYGRVQSDSGGVLVRYKPGGQSITTVQNGYLAQILEDTPVVIDGATWIHVIIKTINRDIDGWVLQDRIETATPSFTP